MRRLHAFVDEVATARPSCRLPRSQHAMMRPQCSINAVSIMLAIRNEYEHTLVNWRRFDWLPFHPHAPTAFAVSRMTLPGVLLIRDSACCMYSARCR